MKQLRKNMMENLPFIMMKWWNDEICCLSLWWNDEILLPFIMMKWWNDEILLPFIMMKWWNDEILLIIYDGIGLSQTPRHIATGYVSVGIPHTKNERLQVFSPRFRQPKWNRI